MEMTRAEISVLEFMRENPGVPAGLGHAQKDPLDRGAPDMWVVSTAWGFKAVEVLHDDGSWSWTARWHWGDVTGRE